MRKIGAVLGNIKKIYDGSDLSHVDKELINIFLNESKEIENPLNASGEGEIKSLFDSSLDTTHNSKLNAELDISTKYLSTENPFRNAKVPTINEDKPGMPFLEYFNDLIENLDFFSRLKWSTIYTHAEINHTTANEIRQGKRAITANYLFRFIIAMQLSDMVIVRSLLKKAGIALRIGMEPDTAVAMAITYKIYNRRFINEYLIDKGEEPLFPKLAKELNQISY